jgi:hypothetical protein
MILLALRVAMKINKGSCFEKLLVQGLDFQPMEAIAVRITATTSFRETTSGWAKH